MSRLVGVPRGRTALPGATGGRPTCADGDGTDEGADANGPPGDLLWHDRSTDGSCACFASLRVLKVLLTRRLSFSPLPHPPRLVVSDHQMARTLQFSVVAPM